MALDDMMFEDDYRNWIEGNKDHFESEFQKLRLMRPDIVWEQAMGAINMNILTTLMHEEWRKNRQWLPDFRQMAMLCDELYELLWTHETLQGLHIALEAICSLHRKPQQGAIQKPKAKRAPMFDPVKPITPLNEQRGHDKSPVGEIGDFKEFMKGLGMVDQDAE